MLNNDVLRSVRYSLDLPDAVVADIVQLSGGQLGADKAVALLKRDDEEGFIACDDEVLAHFLDGLVIHKRGREDGRPPRPIQLPITNNLVLKKLRVAFELKDDDMHAILQSAGLAVSKPELSALFRSPGSKNYRPAGDQLLRNFLKGLALRFRAPEAQ